MKNIAEAANSNKPKKAFYASLYNGEVLGILTMDEHGAVWFREHGTSALTLITPELYEHVFVNGEVGFAEGQYLADQRRGGYAAVACGRAS